MRVALAIIVLGDVAQSRTYPICVLWTKVTSQAIVDVNGILGAF